MLDSRNPAGTPAFNGKKDVPVTGGSCGTGRRGAMRAERDRTVVPPGPLGFLTLWAQGQPQPLAGSLKAIDGAA